MWPLIIVIIVLKEVVRFLSSPDFGLGRRKKVLKLSLTLLFSCKVRVILTVGIFYPSSSAVPGALEAVWGTFPGAIQQEDLEFLGSIPPFGVGGGRIRKPITVPFLSLISFHCHSDLQRQKLISQSPSVGCQGQSLWLRAELAAGQGAPGKTGSWQLQSYSCRRCSTLSLWAVQLDSSSSNSTLRANFRQGQMVLGHVLARPDRMF